MKTSEANGVVTIIDSIGAIRPVPRVVAVEALEQSLLGRAVFADHHLASIEDRAERVIMCTTLVDIAAGALDALRDRSRFLVPIELIFTWLGQIDPVASETCWVILQRAVFRSAGVEMPVTSRLTDDEVAAELSASLLVARGLVELVARRRWRRPHAMLADVLCQVSRRRWIEPDQAFLDTDADRLEA